MIIQNRHVHLYKESMWVLHTDYQCKIDPTETFSRQHNEIRRALQTFAELLSNLFAFSSLFF